jgi:hypothetical protein
LEKVLPEMLFIRGWKSERVPDNGDFFSHVIPMVEE